jgi:hypothetical protein
MRRVAGLLLAVLVAIPLLWFGSGFVYETRNTYTHRFRLGIEVDDNGQTRAGSSVIDVSIREKATWVPQTGGIIPAVRGEAVFVDLGSGRNLLALLALGPRGESDIYNLAARGFGRDRPFWYREAPKWQGRAELTGPLIPTLVTFSDLNDPKTVRVVSPNELPSILGSGVSFKSAWIEMTRDALTKEIEEKLPWLAHTEVYRSDPGNPFTSTLQFGRRHFIQER